MPGKSVGELSVPPKGVEAVVTQCAAWSAREIELQALATLHARQIPTPSAAHFLKSPLNEHFRTDRDIRPVRKLYSAVVAELDQDQRPARPACRFSVTRFEGCVCQQSG